MPGRPPAFQLSAQQVEDKSLKPIQYLTPGLLGWAIASGGAFGAALTLVGWRKNKLLRRLRLAPRRVPANGACGDEKEGSEIPRRTGKVQ